MAEDTVWAVDSEAPGSSRRTVAAVLVLLVVGAAVAVAGVGAPPSDAVNSPERSALRAVEDLFPPRRLTVAEISRGGPTCLEGKTLVLTPGGGCTFIIPNGVHVAEFRRVPGSPGMMMTITKTGDLTDTVDTASPGPDPAHPLELRFATVHNGTTVTLFDCAGPGACRLQVGK